MGQLITRGDPSSKDKRCFRQWVKLMPGKAAACLAAHLGVHLPGCLAVWLCLAPPGSAWRCLALSLALPGSAWLCLAATMAACPHSWPPARQCPTGQQASQQLNPHSSPTDRALPEENTFASPCHDSRCALQPPVLKDLGYDVAPSSPVEPDGVQLSKNSCARDVCAVGNHEMACVQHCFHVIATGLLLS